MNNLGLQTNKINPGKAASVICNSETAIGANEHRDILEVIFCLFKTKNVS